MVEYNKFCCVLMVFVYLYYGLLVLQIVLLMTLVILVQISGLIGYPSVILSLAPEARDGRDNCMKVLCIDLGTVQGC